MKKKKHKNRLHACRDFFYLFSLDFMNGFQYFFYIPSELFYVPFNFGKLVNGLNINFLPQNEM